MAFIRCLAPDIVDHLSSARAFVPANWQVYRVADVALNESRTITADQAVELRENKKQAILLLVDTDLAGAGMDGIYSAAREIPEAELFEKALRLAAREITNRHSRDARQYAERAVKTARGHGGRRHSISQWTELDFLVRVADAQCHPGEFVHLLGLWPAVSESGEIALDELLVCRTFVDQLLSSAVAGLTPVARIEALRLLSPTPEQVEGLERFIREATTKPITASLAGLEGHRHLWVNSLRIESAAQELQEIQLASWRTRGGKLARWSGLIEGIEDSPPELVLRADADKTGEYSKLEVRWTTRPANLEKNAVQYRVAIVTEHDEELAAREMSHGGKKEEKCRFSNDDFMMLSEDALISAKVVVSAVGQTDVESQESDEFIIRFGEPPERQSSGVGKKFRCFSEGLIEFDDRDEVTRLAS